MIQQFIHAGRPHGQEDACKDVHCASCGRDGPRRYATVCGECFHGWRWRWLLSLHDARTFWRMTRKTSWDPAGTPLWRRVRVRRPSRVWICPCCTHDL